MNALRSIDPDGWKKPVGYSNGMLGRGQMLLVGGMVGWDGQQQFHSDVLHEQWAQALDNVLDVVKAAGGKPEHIARLTVYVVDRKEYAAQRKEIGAAWKARMGRHYPAMALLEVKGLLEDRARVEMEATAILPD